MSVRIAHLSDIHFGDEDPGAVAAAPEAVAAFAPTLTVVTGDLTAIGRRREFAAARAWLDRLPSPVLVTPGNHDTPYWNPVLRAIEPFARYRRFIGDAYAGDFDGPRISARSVNSARGVQARLNWSKGALSIGALAGLAWPAGEGVVRLFACHHPLVDLAGAPVTGEVRRGPQAAAMLEQRGVELLLSGHLHNAFAVRLGQSACYALGAGTLSTRLRGAPASFSTVEIDDREISVVVRPWRNGRFEAGPVRRMPRLRN